MKRPRKPEPSPADIALWETTVHFGQTAQQRMRAIVQLMKLRGRKA